jgi:hypothetical protein
MATQEGIRIEENNGKTIKKANYCGHLISNPINEKTCNILASNTLQVVHNEKMAVGGSTETFCSKACTKNCLKVLQ